jgi:hypothetical protein
MIDNGYVKRKWKPVLYKGVRVCSAGAEPVNRQVPLLVKE